MATKKAILISESIPEFKESIKNMSEDSKRVVDLTLLLTEKDKEIERLKGLIEQQEEEENNPYWYWPQCDVEGCEGVSCRGGGVWEETGYWSVCSEHSQDFRDFKPQPKMKQASIDREATRDEDGCLPNKNL